MKRVRELPRRPSNWSQGSALVLALMSLTVLTILMLSMTSLRVSEMRGVSSNVRATHAQLYAESGIETVLAWIIGNSSTISFPVTKTFSNVPVGIGTFSASLDTDPSSGAPRITSTGVAGSVERTVEVLLSLEMRNAVLQQFAILACHDLAIGNGQAGKKGVQNGDIYSGGNLTVDKTGLINGDAIARGNVSLTAQDAVSGNVISTNGNISGKKDTIVAGGYASNPDGNATLQGGKNSGKAAKGFNHDEGIWGVIPDYCHGDYYADNILVSDEEFAAYEAKAVGMGAGHVINGDTHISGGHYEGVYYIRGNLKINGGYSGSATFVVEGNLHINGNVKVSNPGDDSMAFVVKGDVTKGNGNAEVDGVIYANGQADLRGNLQVNGAIVMASLDGSSELSGSAFINYVPPSDDLDLPNAVFAGASVDRWRLVSRP